MNSVGNGSALSPLSSMAARCFWDADTDSYAHDVFMNVSIVCFTMGKCKATCFCMRGRVTLNVELTKNNHYKEGTKTLLKQYDLHPYSLNIFRYNIQHSKSYFHTVLYEGRYSHTIL